MLFVDTFNGNFETENARAAVARAAGRRLHGARRPQQGAAAHLCCGRTYLASGMVGRGARPRRAELLDALLPFAERGIAIVGLEPSCLLTLRDEMLGDGPRRATPQVLAGAGAAVRGVPRARSRGRPLRRSALKPLAQPDPGARPLPPEGLRRGHAGARRAQADSGREARADRELSCCGMAGSFGYEASHYDGVDADGRAEPAAGGARSARRDRGRRRHQLPPPDRRRRAARGGARRRCCWLGSCNSAAPRARNADASPDAQESRTCGSAHSALCSICMRPATPMAA